MGLGFNEVPPEFGWDMVLFEPILEQSVPKDVQGPSEVQTKVIDVNDDSSLFEEDFDSVLVETRSEPVPESSNPQLELNPIYEERLDDFLDDFSKNVADIDLGERLETPIETVQTTPIQTPQIGEGQKKKRIKVHAGQTDLLFVRQFGATQAKTSSSPSQPESATPKPTPKQSRKFTD